MNYLNFARKLIYPWELYMFPFWAQLLSTGLSLIGGAQAAGKAGEAQRKGEEYLGSSGEEFGDISSRADEWLSRYDELYQPIERGLAERVAEGPQYGLAEGRATADVAMSFDKAREIEDRRMQRYGIDPSSGRYRSRGRQYDLGRAASEVESRNLARRQEEDRDWARRMAFTKMGRGLESGALLAKSRAAEGYGGIGGRYFGLSEKYGKSAGRGFGTAGKLLSAFGGFGGGGDELLGPDVGYNEGDDMLADSSGFGEY